MAKSKLDWAGEFQTMGYQMASCTSEEQMYRKLTAFKEDFLKDYKKLSKRKRRKDGFPDWDD